MYRSIHRANLTHSYLMHALKPINFEIFLLIKLSRWYMITCNNKWHGYNVNPTSVVTWDTIWMITLTLHRPLGSCRDWDSAGREGKASMPVNFNQDESLQFPRLSKTVMESVRFSKDPPKLWPVEYKHSEFFSDSGAFLIRAILCHLTNEMPFVLPYRMQLAGGSFSLFTVYLLQHVYFRPPSCTICQISALPNGSPHILKLSPEMLAYFNTSLG